MSLHVDAGERVNVSIKSKERQYRRVGGQPLSQTMESWKKEDNKNTKLHILLGWGSITGATQTTVRWPRPSLSNLHSTNYIVWAFYVRTQHYLGVVTNWDPTAYLFIHGLFYEYHIIVKQHTLENIIIYFKKSFILNINC